MTDELDDFEPFDCQTVGRVIDSFEMLKILRTINTLVADVKELKIKQSLTGLDVPDVKTETTAT